MPKTLGSMSEELANAAQAIARAKMTPEAMPVMQQLDQLQGLITVLAQHGQMQQMAGGSGAAGGAPSVAGAGPGGPPPGPPAGRPAPGNLPAAPGQGLFPQSPIPNAQELAALTGSRAGM